MKVLFCCTGNTCRSCMAEAIFNRFNNNSEMKATSAGISIVNKSLISKHAVSVINHYMDVDISGRIAVQVNSEILETSDLVLTMTSNIKKAIISKYPSYMDKVYTLNEYVGIEGDIIDPYGKDESSYKDTYKLLKESIELLFKKLNVEIEVSESITPTLKG